MKKLISFVIILSMALSICIQSVNAETVVACQSVGDVNSNGKINLEDVSLVLKHIAKWSDLTIDLSRADVTNDNNINLSDVTVLLKYIAKWDGISFGHSYSNYKCSKCGEVDISHSYEYLCDWLLNNGQTYAEYVYIENRTSNEYVSIQYYPGYGNISLSYFTYDGDYSLLTSVYIYGDSTIASYISGNDYCRISGYIDISSFTPKYPLSCTSCDPGYFETEYNMVENTRTRINYLLNGTRELLDSYDIGIILADLGFKSYVYGLIG